jgi:hypothetical protein
MGFGIFHARFGLDLQNQILTTADGEDRLRRVFDARHECPTTGAKDCDLSKRVVLWGVGGAWFSPL